MRTTSISRRVQRVSTPLEVADYIDRFTPNSVAPADWDLVAVVTRDAVHRLRPQTRKQAYSHLWDLYGYLLWCARVGLALDLEESLRPEHVERYVSLEVPDASRRTVRGRLQLAGRALTARAPWPAPPPRYGRSPVPPPYGPGEVARLWHAARHQGSEARGRVFVAVLVLGLGCGLDGRWAPRVRGSDVNATDGVGVRVGLPARVVPCLDRYAEELAELARRAGEGLVVGAPSGPNRLVCELGAAHEGLRLHLGRLRSTWIVEHLDAGVPPPVLLEAAGSMSAQTLMGLIGHMRPASVSSVALLRGATA